MLKPVLWVTYSSRWILPDCAAAVAIPPSPASAVRRVICMAGIVSQLLRPALHLPHPDISGPVIQRKNDPISRHGDAEPVCKRADRNPSGIVEMSHREGWTHRQFG